MARFNGMGSVQYFDNVGQPLSGGFLYFYESGSTTPKTTYSDADQTIPNTNPVVLDAAGRQADIFFNGSAKVVIADADDVQIDVIDPIGGAVTRDAFADWNSLITYDAEDIVQGSNDKYYLSINNDNIGNDPTSTSGEWNEIKFVYIWDTAYTYVSGDLATASDGALYRCSTATSQGNDPTLEEDWTKVGSSGVSIPDGTVTSSILRWSGSAWVEVTDFTVDGSGNVSGVSASFSGDMAVDTNTLFVDVSANSVGINTATPSANLHVVEGTATGTTPNASANTLALDASGAGGLSILTPNNVAGNIFFGDTEGSASGRITYNHSDNAMRFYTVGAVRLTLDSSGDGTFSGDVYATDFLQSSDMALKYDFRPITGALEKLGQLVGGTYKWRANGVASAGYTYQAVRKVLPEATRRRKDGAGGVIDAGVVGLLIEAVKELKTEVEALRDNQR